MLWTGLSSQQHFLGSVAPRVSYGLPKNQNVMFASFLPNGCSADVSPFCSFDLRTVFPEFEFGKFERWTQKPWMFTAYHLLEQFASQVEDI